MYIEAVLSGFKMIQVPSNPELRIQLEKHSLAELSEILSRMKRLHNTSEVDTKKRAVRAIEIESYYENHPEIEIELPKLNPLIIGVDIDRDLRREKITRRLKTRLDEGMVDEVKNPMYATGVGLVIFGSQSTENHNFNEVSDKSVNKIIQRTKQWFKDII